jgi:hypothetical protein
VKVSSFALGAAACVVAGVAVPTSAQAQSGNCVWHPSPCIGLIQQQLAQALGPEYPDDLFAYPTAEPSPPGAAEGGPTEDEGDQLEAEDAMSTGGKEGGADLDEGVYQLVLAGQLTLQQALAADTGYSCIGGPFHRVVRRSAGGWKVRFGGVQVCNKALNQAGQSLLETPTGDLAKAGRGYNAKTALAITRGSKIGSSRKSYQVRFFRSMTLPAGRVWAVRTPNCGGLGTRTLTCDETSRIFR